MLTVTISNIDTTFTGVFDTADHDIAAAKAVDDLIANHGFFPENKSHKCLLPHLPPHESAYGIVLMDDEEEEETISDENTYLILISEFTPNKMIAVR